MKDGYYLSTYISVDYKKQILSVIERHDQNLSLWKKNGNHIELVHYWELERFTGHKYHNISFEKRYAEELIAELLSTLKITVAEINDIWGTKELSLSPELEIEHFCDDFAIHSQIHNYSVMLSDMNFMTTNNIIILCLDGEPDYHLEDIPIDKSLYSGAIYINGICMEKFSVESPGILWTYATKNYLKVDIDELLDYIECISAELIDYEDTTPEFQNLTAWGNADSYMKKLVNYVDSLKECDIGVKYKNYDDRFTKDENKWSMIGKQLQNVSLKIIQNNIDNIIKKYGIDPQNYYLLLSGTLALNSSINSFLRSIFKFKDIKVTSYVNDSGMSIGIGLYHFYKQLGDMKVNLVHAYYGDNCDLEEFLNSGEFSDYVELIEKNVSNRQIVEDVLNDAIIWIYGRTEIGPRSLSHRCVLLDPTNRDCLLRLNQAKQRQWWRPAEVIILADEINEWFESPCLSPYKTYAFKLKKEKQKYIPAVSQFNEKVRVQTIQLEHEMKIYEILSIFKNKTGIPLLGTLSLNDKDEPIINTIEETFNFALRKNIKIIYINGERIVLKNHRQYSQIMPYQRRYRDFFLCKTMDEYLEWNKKLNPYGLKLDDLVMYFQSERMRSSFELTSEKDVKKLHKVSKLLYKRMGVEDS